MRGSANRRLWQLTVHFDSARRVFPNPPRRPRAAPPALLARFLSEPFPASCSIPGDRCGGPLAAPLVSSRWLLRAYPWLRLAAPSPQRPPPRSPCRDECRACGWKRRRRGGGSLYWSPLYGCRCLQVCASGQKANDIKSEFREVVGEGDFCEQGDSLRISKEEGDGTLVLVMGWAWLHIRRRSAQCDCFIRWGVLRAAVDLVHSIEFLYS